MQFYEWNTKVYRLLSKGENGNMWVIDLDGRTAPKRISAEVAEELEPISPPQDVISEAEMSPLRKERMEERKRMIAELIKDDICAFDKKERNERIALISEQCGASRSTLQRWYYMYLGWGDKGLAPKSKESASKRVGQYDDVFRWALNKYYYSARKMSMREAYELMLLARFATPTGELVDEYPSLAQFRRYNDKHKTTFQTAVSRNGKTAYKRNTRPLYGRAADRVDGIGCYEMDATIADIYLVSSKDNALCVGRPVIYLATDVFSQLIAGIYVGFEQGESAVIECLRNAAADKVKYCAGYGIEITPEDWPSQGLPEDIVSDKGAEFFSGRVKEICEIFGVRATSLPAYRPDLKGTVEKAFDLIQRRYKTLLAEKGVIAVNYAERGAPDYRREAKLTLYEYTQVVINVVLYLNAHRVIDRFIRPVEMAREDVPVIASCIWQWYRQHGTANITAIDTQEQLLTLYPRGIGKFTRRGLEFRGLYYKNRAFDERCATAGINGKKNATVAYDVASADAVWLFENGKYYMFSRTSTNDVFCDTSWAEAEAYVRREKSSVAKLRAQQTEASVKSMAFVVGVGESAKKRHTGLLDRDAIKGIPDARTDELTREELHDGD